MVALGIAFACGGAALATLLDLPRDSFVLFVVLAVAIATAKESFAFSVFSMPSFGAFGTLLVSPETFGNVKMLVILYIAFVLIGAFVAYFLPYLRRKFFPKKNRPQRETIRRPVSRKKHDLADEYWKVA